MIDKQHREMLMLFVHVNREHRFARQNPDLLPYGKSFLRDRRGASP